MKKATVGFNRSKSFDLRQIDLAAPRDGGKRSLKREKSLVSATTGRMVSTKARPAAGGPTN